MKFVWIVATCASMVLALLTFAFFADFGPYIPIIVFATTYSLVVHLLEPSSRFRHGRRVGRVVRRVGPVRPALVPAGPRTTWQPAVVLERAPRVEIFGAEHLSNSTDALVRLDGWARGRGDFPELATALRGTMPGDETHRALTSLGRMLVAPHERDAAVWALGKLSAIAGRRGVLPVDVSRVGRAFGDTDGVLARFAAIYGHSSRSMVLIDVHPFTKLWVKRRPGAWPLPTSDASDWLAARRVSEPGAGALGSDTRRVALLSAPCGA